MEETKVTTGDAGFHCENTMQKIGGELKHLAMAKEVDRYIVTKMK